jgi:hypothetical protein
MRRALCAFLLSAAVATSGPGASGASGFPAPAGWAPAGEVLTFGRGELWEYIDGAADAFLAYGFREVRVRDLSSGDITVSVAVYDMGTPLNAFGMYRSERPGGEPAVAAGAEATVLAPDQCLLLKDAYYVKVDVLDGRLSADAGESLVRAIAAALPGRDGLPASLAVLPAAGRVAGSEGYARESFLGLSDLKGCLHATYRDEGGAAYPAFFLVPGDGEALESIWARLAERWEPIEREGAPVLLRTIPYRGLAGVIRTERGILGAAGAPDRETLLARLERLAR